MHRQLLQAFAVQKRIGFGDHVEFHFFSDSVVAENIAVGENLSHAFKPVAILLVQRPSDVLIQSLDGDASVSTHAVNDAVDGLGLLEPGENVTKMHAEKRSAGSYFSFCWVFSSDETRFLLRSMYL